MFPLQITLPLPKGAIVIVGVGLIRMLVVSAFDKAFAQPVALFVPLMVYVVFVVGLKVKLVPVKLPGFRVYVLAPVGLITNDEPLQIALPLPKGMILIVGVGLTIILVVSALDTAFAQPVVLLLPFIV